MDDLELVVVYLQKQWLPPDVKDALRHLEAAPRLALGHSGLGPALVPNPAGRYLDLKRPVE